MFVWLWVFLIAGTAHSKNVARLDNEVPQQCQPGKWRDLKNESQVLKGLSQIVKRKGARLEVHPKQGAAWIFRDAKTPGADLAQHRVVAVAPDQSWVTLFEPAFDSTHYRLLFLKSRQDIELSGCPLWSPDGQHFVTLNEDLESGQTVNEVSLWSCVAPHKFCESVWHLDVGGRNVHWTADGRAVLLVSHLNEHGDAQTATLECQIEGPCSQPKW